MNKTTHISKPPARILVIALRFLGDVLLTTPLIHSLKLAYPQAKIDVLVYRNTAAMLEGNADIHQVITTPNRPKFADYRQLLGQLFRRYDLAVATQSGDRPFIYTLLAASKRIAVVPPKPLTGWWKRFFMQGWTEFDDDDTHTVLQHLKILELIHVPPSYTLIPPQLKDSAALLQRFAFPANATPYAVLHPHPQWTYKQWTQQGWLEAGQYLHEQGLKLVLSGGPSDEERAYVSDIARQLPEGTVNLAGQVSLAELSFIIGKAKLYLGPDTGITHLAAATGVPVIALFGPTNPVKWAPWPYGYNQNKNPFTKRGCQRVNNIYLCQGQGDCVPCHLEGCDRNQQSRSRCLDELSVEKVKEAIRQMLRM